MYHHGQSVHHLTTRNITRVTISPHHSRQNFRNPEACWSLI